VKSFGNFGNVAIEELRNVNPLSVLDHKYIVIADPKVSLAVFEDKKTKKAKKADKK
jgi:hypothetical protein